MIIDTTGNGNADANMNGGAVNQDSLLKEKMRDEVERYMKEGSTKKQIKNLLIKDNQRLGVSIDDLRKSNPDLAKYV